MSFNNVLPLAVGSSSTSASFAGNLGEVYEVGAAGSPGWKLYRMVKNGAVALVKNAAVVTAFTLGLPTWVVVASDTANDPNVAGVVPADVGSTGVPIGAYFLVQVAGAATPNAAATTLSRTSIGPIITTGTAGTVQAFTAVTDPAVVVAATMGNATNSAAVTAAQLPITVWLEGLL